MGNNTSNTEAMAGLLDETLDDLEDLPSFEPYPNGAHRVTAVFEPKMVNENPCFELKMKLIETIEYADAADAEKPMKPGSEAGTLFMRNNEIGQGKFKALMKPLAAHFGTSKIGELFEAIKGTELVVITKQRTDTKKEKTYMDVVSMSVV